MQCAQPSRPWVYFVSLMKMSTALDLEVVSKVHSLQGHKELAKTLFGTVFFFHFASNASRSYTHSVLLSLNVQSLI